MKNQIAVIIGRFQPFHNAHLKMIQAAASENETVVILVGSSNRSATFKNPLSFQERRFMIGTTLLAEGIDNRVIILPIDDYPYNDASWVAGIHKQVSSVVESLELEDVKPEIRIYGHEKDETTYYLELFPKWELKKLPSYENGMSATEIRECLYEGKDLDGVHPIVNDRLMKFIESEQGINIKKEYEFIKAYKKNFESLPYAPVFSTTDVVVYYKGYVLMVQRRGYPGKGQWALPGGFLEPDLRIKDSMIKELKEETSIRVAKPILYSNLRKIEVFDDPSRSLRGRTVTHCGLIILDSVTTLQQLPKVKGGSDASYSMWVSINELEDIKHNIFEDHYFIIKQMLHMN